ncbi:MAG: efflux RND transporter periplasmic adaptor subunit, partial [Planctomycetes bacterium]|nr:efflux RND transporter periplasmic adaptor subunit [Planctomycetota bacterium]
MKKTILIIGVFVLVIVAFSLGKCSSATVNIEHDNETVNQEEAIAAAEYTCSMHPQFRTTDKDAVCPICFMDLIPVPAGADNVPPNAIAMSDSAMKRAQIEVAPVIRAFPRRVIQLVGSVETDERTQATITAWFPGRIDELYVDFTGAVVTSGDALANIYSPELLVAKSELQEAANSVNRIKGDSIIARTAKETYTSARKKLARWGLNEAQIDGLENDENPSDTIVITSPIDGVVIAREIVSGEYVKTGQKLFQIANLDTVWVMLEAHETEIPFLHIGQEIELETDILPGKVIKS